MTSSVVQGNGRRARPLYKDLSLQILVAMLLGSLVGYLWPRSAESLRPLGDLFIRLVRMIVAPIIFCTVVHGIASVGYWTEVFGSNHRAGTGFTPCWGYLP